MLRENLNNKKSMCVDYTTPCRIVYGPSILHLVTVKVINQDSNEFLDSYGCYHDSVFQDVTS